MLCTLINRACVVDAIDDSVTGSFQQIDLNRHLEEIATRVEELLTARLQHYALSGTGPAAVAAIVRLLASWEKYTQVADGCGGARDAIAAPNHTAVSADLISFKKRLQSLDSVYDVIRTCAMPPSGDDAAMLQHIRAKLAELAGAVQHAATLNSGGHFEWVDSKIVTSFKFGRIICLEHVNLCSAAILDRLNPMFEADGSLLLAEKGVSAADEPEIVYKHPHFNAFLTLDPKNGEISRAMRNRCIELNISREEYDADDLKSLIYATGVCEMHLIQAIVDIHRRCRDVSDFSAMGVAHVTKCADLVLRNRQLGSSDADALQRSALEVYVRSANIDLTGFGLAFYRGQLKQAIADVVESLTARIDMFDYANVVDKADDLNAFTLVRKQCEVFLTVMRGQLDDRADIRTELSGLFGAFEQSEIACDQLLCRLLLTVIYECSSPADLELRRIYLGAEFDRMRRTHVEHPLIESMHELNEQLATDIRTGVPADSDLPWNTQIFPRLLRFYEPTVALTAAAQLRLGALLASRAFLAAIRIGTNTKLSQIDALTFSHAVESKSMQNVPNNELVQHLYAYLSQLQPHLVAMLQHTDWTMTAGEAVDLVCAYLWHNRLYAVSGCWVVK